jgi:hypothetical protein
MATGIFIGGRYNLASSGDPMNDTDIALISHVIQLSVAPVFLISGVGALLGVMANRLARVIDRARLLESHWKGFDAQEQETARAELRILARRAHFTSWAINFAAASALLVCVVIVGLFVEAMLHANIRWALASIFVMSMMSLIAGVVCFLREVDLATHTLRIGPPGENSLEEALKRP